MEIYVIDDYIRKIHQHTLLHEGISGGTIVEMLERHLASCIECDCINSICNAEIDFRVRRILFRKGGQ